ncbi:Iron sulfur cluster assembly protein 1, mitochondrial [Stagonosporopsis vannaccii]|nr:Iron sulfur cluster assembly protein 1, mitochondrial [Stagonosporopsis vannaccii]
MFRRVAAAVPAQAGRVLATAARPSIVSPLRTAAPTISVAGTRQYHEKDKSHCCAMMLTSPALLDHYNRPRNVGSMSKTDTDVGTGLVGAPACGDVMKLQIRVDPNNNTISDVKFKTFGCGSAIASSSYLTELVRGMTLEDAARIKNTEIAKELCLPPVKLHCSMLAEDAIKSAISNYYTKNPKARATDLGGKSAPLPKVEVETVSATA